MNSTLDPIPTPNNELELQQKYNSIIFKNKLESSNLQETLDQIKVNNAKANNTKTFNWM